MVVAHKGWTFKQLRAASEDVEGTAGTAANTSQRFVPVWAWALIVVLGIGTIAGIAVGIAAATGAFDGSSNTTTPSPPPAPYSADDSTAACNNDCLGCNVNGGCTYSYGAGGASHDSRTYQSNGVCDDGGQGAQTTFCDLGSDCADCGPRVVP